KCFKAHDKMPYRWQVQEGDQWNALPDNETIEKEYSDPGNTYSSSSPPVHFDTMTRGGNKVRRLSTVNSLVEPNFIHTTEWLWYWQDEFGKWNRYGSDSTGRKSADINSATLEQKFLDNENDVVEFSAGSQSYSLSFQDMIQTNKRYSTKRLVSRRPQFVSAADVRTKKVRDKSLPCLETPSWLHFPHAVRCSYSFQEFLNVRNLLYFSATEVDACSVFSLMSLFLIPGSYFARDAKYSHSYTGDSDVKTMFITRVLVGSYTEGKSSYVRPPSKDSGDINFYDSCVDNIANPSIFVVFEKHQIYPEYLLQYKTTQLAVNKPSTSMSVQQPKPGLHSGGIQCPENTTNAVVTADYTTTSAGSLTG
ncbi:hypothetical protein XENOCAPTIV_003540, partial [Xenoophorus captivus]